MKRRDFLKRFGVGAAAVVAAPAILSHPPDPEIWGSITTVGDPPTGMEIIQEGTLTREEVMQFDELGQHKQYPMTYEECYTDMWQDEKRRKEMAKHWPKLVKRYGKSVSITDFLKAIP